MSANVRQTNGECAGRTVESAILTGTQESSEDSSCAHPKESKPIEIDGRQNIYSVAFLGDSKHVVSGGQEGKICRWRVEDGRKVGRPMDTRSPILCIALSRDGQWAVSGTESGQVMVWNAKRHSKVIEWKAHNNWVRAVDVSLDGTRITTGSKDKTVCVWSLSTGERLLGPFKHVESVVVVKFSPDGRLIATGTWNSEIRVYDNQTGGLLVSFPVQVCWTLNQSLAWGSDGKQLFASSGDANVHCLDVSTTGTTRTLSQWAIHSIKDPRCIALARNGTFIAVSTNSLVSFWDTTSHEQIGSLIAHPYFVWSMAISTNYHLVIGGNKTITIRGLCDILPCRYLHNVCVCV